jgi:hypothetical protein
MTRQEDCAFKIQLPLIEVLILIMYHAVLLGIVYNTGLNGLTNNVLEVAVIRNCGLKSARAQ